MLEMPAAVTGKVTAIGEMASGHIYPLLIDLAAPNNSSMGPQSEKQTNNIG